MSDRLKMPPERDFGFYQRRKHDKWRMVAPPDPALEAPVADSHAHVHMLPDPAWELARCAANGVDFMCMIVDPTEDGSRPFDELNAWTHAAQQLLGEHAAQQLLGEHDAQQLLGEHDAQQLLGEHAASSAHAVPNAPDTADAPDAPNAPDTSDTAGAPGAPDAHAASTARAVPAVPVRASDGARIPAVALAVGVHPHNAKLYDEETARALQERLVDPRVCVLGEIGLDYHYDLSPRDIQRDVFRTQIRLAKQHNLPIALHLRGGEDPQRDNAHDEAFRILEAENALGPQTLLHCCTLGADELTPWIKADCYIAYGGALTFKNAAAVREAAALVPENRLLLETDAPYMTPEPMRGAACTPAHVVFTAAALAATRGVQPGDARKAFLQQIHRNTLAFMSPASTRQS